MSDSLVFLHPLLLIGILLLPLFWLILSALPPQPVLRKFPPIGYLRNLQDKTASPQKIPLWLRLLRLLMIVSIVLAVASPVLLPRQDQTPDQPLLLLVDDGWANASNWAQVKASALARLSEADLADQSVALLFTTQTEPQNLRFTPYAQLRELLQAHQPNPVAPNHAIAAQTILDARQQNALPKTLSVIWLSDGFGYEGTSELIDLLSQNDHLQILTGSGHNQLRITALHHQQNDIAVQIAGPIDYAGAVLAEDKDGKVLARSAFVLAKDQPTTEVKLTLPLQLRNRMGAVRIESIASAAAVHLVGTSWVRPRIGLIGARNQSGDQPLLSERFYLEKALSPYAEIRDIERLNLIDTLPPILILLDTGKLSDPAHQRLSDFVQQGGLLIRFAGPRLAERQDDLIPVALRKGGRLLGSSLGWDQPQQLAEFSDTSPFYRLDHSVKINVHRQVLAASSPGLAKYVWARLTDGTPLVTSSTHGNGRIILFHVTASPDWSELPLAGIFVEMLQRILPLAGNPVASDTLNQTPTTQVDLKMAISASGQLEIPQGTHQILSLSNDNAPVSTHHPAGLWGNDKLAFARNVLDHLNLSAFPAVPDNVQIGQLDNTKPVRFTGWLLALALLLLIVDTLVILAMTEKLSRWTKPGLSASIVFLVVMVSLGRPAPAVAQDFDPFASIEQTRLAYVITGNDRVDRFSHAGLKGLSRELYLRTTVEPGEPIAIDLETDDLNVVLLLYWPIFGEVELSEAAAKKLNAYLKNGGMLVIDTQDGGLRATQSGGLDPALQSLFGQIDLPGLHQAPDDHVLTRAYYLIQSFPGRYAKSPVWVEADRKGSSLDGVSSLVIGANDWAAAWAIDQNGQPLAGLSGEIDNQREMSRRFGINLVMYVLAGNYKADQVHIPALLERLEQ